MKETTFVKKKPLSFFTNTCVFINDASIWVAPGGFICGNKGGGEWKFHSYYFSFRRVVVVGEKHTMIENENRVCKNKGKITQKTEK